MKPLKPHEEIEREELSTGQLVTLSKFYRKYHVMLTNTEELGAPELWQFLDKKTAYTIYTDILRSDVLEV